MIAMAGLARLQATSIASPLGFGVRPRWPLGASD
jgi:tRNA A37 threonylcarbamoyltransferase TsaD